jgi:WD40 repeat protein
MALGDDGGYVHALRVIDKTDSEKSPGSLVRFEELWKQKTHDDWVNRVLYMTELDAVGSCSLDRTIVITDVERRAAVRTLIGHGKGVHAIDWSPKLKFLVSCGMERNVLLWNPFSVKSIGQLVGHTSSVVDVLINEVENQIVTLGMDKSIRVWDIRNHKCLQTFHDRQAYRPDNRLGSMLYDPKRRTLVAASVQPKAWRLISKDRTSAAGHSHPCVAAMFNAHFQQVVTADQAGCVCAWDVHTGEVDFRFQQAHGAHKLTAAGFDGGGRRLITGGSDGTLRVWNFSNGNMLKELTASSREEVTAVVHTGGSNQKRMVGVGWNHLVSFWDDDDRKIAPCSRQLRGHDADVLCIAQAPPAILATGDFDGVIIIWNVESGAVRHKLAPPPLPDAGGGGGGGGNAYAPVTDRAAESLSFVSGSGAGAAEAARDAQERGASATPPLVLAASYADGHVRFWNVTEGRCVADFHAGHRAGESVLAVATDPGGTRMVTGDSVGRVRLWDISRVVEAIFDGGGVAGRAAGEGDGGNILGRGDVVLLGYWQAHTTGTCVNSANFFALDDVGTFFLTAAADACVHMWSGEGLHVGKFGRDRWALEDSTTWLSVEGPKGGDAYEIQLAAERERDKAAAATAEVDAEAEAKAEAATAGRTAGEVGYAAAATRRGEGEGGAHTEGMATLRMTGEAVGTAAAAAATSAAARAGVRAAVRAGAGPGAGAGGARALGGGAPGGPFQAKRNTTLNPKP